MWLKSVWNNRKQIACLLKIEIRGEGLQHAVSVVILTVLRYFTVPSLL